MPIVPIDDFTKNITTDNFVKDVTCFFDQVMVMYNMIGQRQDIDICADHSKEDPMQFVLLMESDKEAKELNENLQGRHFSIYGNTYHAELLRSKSSINVILKTDTGDGSN